MMAKAQGVVVLLNHPKFYSQKQAVLALAVAQWLDAWLDPAEGWAKDEKRGPLYLLEPPDNLPDGGSPSSSSGSDD